MGAKWFGASVKRKEDPAFLTGKGRYVDDIHLPGMLEVVVLRSPHPHAAIRGIDKSRALALPGVHAVITHADLPETMRRQTVPLLVPNPAIKQPFMQYCLAKDEVCFVGEPIMLVVAESRYIAEDAAALVDIEFEPLPAIADCAAALAPGASLAHRDAATAHRNLAAHIPLNVGNVDAAFAGAAHIFREKIFQHRGGPFFMECRGMIAAPDPVTDALTIYVSSQGSHRHKRVLLDLLDWADHQLRIVTPDVGGGFGPKGSFYAEYGALAAAAMNLRRPLKWIEDRKENFVSTQQERDQYWDMEIAVDKDARILGIRGQLVHDSGAYMPWGVVLPWIAATTVPGPYVIPNFQLHVLCAFTNKVPTSPVRGAGRPEAAVTMERLMDCIAREMKLDRDEVRRRNFIKPEQMPYKVGIVSRDGRPVTYDSGDYPAAQATALASADVAGFAARQAKARAQGRYIGLGIGNAVESTGLGPYESATVRVSTSGKVTVYTGATPQGQGHKTVLAQIAADQLGCTPDDITVVTSDTAATGLGVGSFAARTAVNAGSSVHLAAKEAADKVRRFAAAMMEVAEGDIEIENGFAKVAGSDVKKSFREIAARAVGMPGFSMAGGPMPGLEATSHFTPDQSTYANGTHVAEVEVDPETGEVTILRYLVQHDCGRIINPMVVEGQVIGGVIHGIGNAFFERMLYDEGAQPTSTTFADYLLPLSTDSPNIDIIHSETPSPLNPLGLKGAGEAGTIPAIATLLSAVENALEPFGVHITEAPITPQRIVALLAEAKAKKAG
ncbi:MAG TPA: xanthine dehydrogenase family protein molybdopterin-binding subunit [Xanthobacteraceae bacterium]|nr:xanthine dehydrogenase family protein molybdopterin-binding subunit [Xanthobacteraceae bacterium]